MYRLLVIFFLIALLLSHSAKAHPLGNFSINQFSKVDAGRSGFRVHQVLDMAEIPTFQEMTGIDTDGDGKISQAEIDAYAAGLTARYVADLRLTINNSSIPLSVTGTSATVLAGAGDLPILRITWDLVGEHGNTAGVHQARFQNLNFAGRVGWNEIIVGREAGVNVFNSSGFATGVTDELKSYPQDAISAPLDERAVEFSFTTGGMPAGSKPLVDRDGRTAPPVQRDKLAELITVPDLTPMIVLLGFLVALGLGAVHAMSPGHGKTIVGAYLVGSRGTFKHAVFLGLIVTATHTIGVFGLGLITLFASNYVLPERFMPFLGFVSGLLVFFIGVTLFKERLFRLLGWGRHEHEYSHDHDLEVVHTHDGYTHTHGGSTHGHEVPNELSWRSLAALGVSGGLLPCPSALVLMLSAISLGRTGYGLLLTLVFSLGLASTLTAIGLVFLYLGKAIGNSSLGEHRLVKLLPVLSSFCIAFMGAAICYSSMA